MIPFLGDCRVAETDQTVARNYVTALLEEGRPVSLPMQDMWIQNVTLTMGLAGTVSIPALLKMVASGRMPAEKIGTHSFTFAQMDGACDVFKNAAENSALEVVITPA